MTDQTAPIGTCWQLVDRSGWDLSGREVEIMAHLLDGRVLVRLGPWSTTVGPVRACETAALDDRDLRDLLRGAMCINP